MSREIQWTYGILREYVRPYRIETLRTYCTSWIEENLAGRYCFGISYGIWFELEEDAVAYTQMLSSLMRESGIPWPFEEPEY